MRRKGVRGGKWDTTGRRSPGEVHEPGHDKWEFLRTRGAMNLRQQGDTGRRETEAKPLRESQTKDNSISGAGREGRAEGEELGKNKEGGISSSDNK